MWPAVPMCPCMWGSDCSANMAKSCLFVLLPKANIQSARVCRQVTRFLTPATVTAPTKTHTDTLPSPPLPPSSKPKLPKTQQSPWKQRKPTTTQRYHRGAWREEEEVDENIYSMSVVLAAWALNLSLETQAWEGWAHLWSVRRPDGEKNVPQ